MDSNHDKEIQNLRCYHYTTRQWLRRSSGTKSGLRCRLCFTRQALAATVLSPGVAITPVATAPRKPRSP